MKVLIVCSGNSGAITPFIDDQVRALQKHAVEIVYFFIKGRGVSGYLQNLSRLKAEITLNKPDLVHAHFGLSGLLAGLQRKTPVVVTFHGSDIHQKKNRPFSRLAMRLSASHIFVSPVLQKMVNDRKGYVIPCGVDREIFYPTDKIACRRKLGFKDEKKYILFSSRFTNPIKNYPLAKAAIDSLGRNDIELIELKNFTRIEVAELMNAVDIALLTSNNEGSPQFVKEALACNCSIVATDVGDIRDLIGESQGSYLVGHTVENVAQGIEAALNYTIGNPKTDGLKRLKQLELFNTEVAQKVLSVYKKAIEM